MASSTAGPNYARRFFWLAALIVTAIAAYTAAWFFLAREVDARAAKALAELSQDGRAARCEDQAVRGYPFRIGLWCDSIAFSDADEDISVSAGDFRSAAQVYQPFFVVGELDGPARVEARDLPPLQFAWDLLHASVRLAEPLPERLSVEGRNVTAAADTGSGAPLFSLRQVEGHMRPNGADLDLALHFERLELEPALTGERSVPLIDGDADLSIDDGVALAATGAESLRGKSATIRSARLGAGDTSLTLSGPVSVDEQGLVDAKLQLSVQNPSELATVLKEALPEFSREIDSFAAGLAALGDQPALPLVVRKGRASLGFLPLGEIPPL